MKKQRLKIDKNNNAEKEKNPTNHKPHKLHTKRRLQINSIFCQPENPLIDLYGLQKRLRTTETSTDFRNVNRRISRPLNGKKVGRERHVLDKNTQRVIFK